MNTQTQVPNVADLLAQVATDTEAARKARTKRLDDERKAEAERKARKAEARALGHSANEADEAKQEVENIGLLHNAKKELEASLKDAKGDVELEERLKGRLSEIDGAITQLEGEGETGRFRSLIARLAVAEPTLGPALYFAEAGVNLKLLVELTYEEAMDRMAANKAAKAAGQRAEYSFIFALPVRGATGKPEQRFFTKHNYDRRTEAEMYDRVFLFVGRPSDEKRGIKGSGFSGLVDAFNDARQQWRAKGQDLDKQALPASRIFESGADGVFRLEALTHEAAYVIQRPGRPDITLYGTFYLKVSGGVFEYLHGPVQITRKMRDLGLVAEDGTPVAVSFGQNFSNLRATQRGVFIKFGAARSFLCQAAGLKEDATPAPTVLGEPAEPVKGSMAAALAAATERNRKAVAARHSAVPTKGRRNQKEREALREHLGPVAHE